MWHSTPFIILEVIVVVHGFSIYPDHTKPCVPNDAWTEDCLKCFCTDKRIVVCQPTYCASNLYLEIDKCEDGSTMFDGCNSCTCIDEYFVCEYNGCTEDAE